ncbi:hypothetical protein CORC01_13161 [Colletotrichum orchidophilum]|uniref:Cytochrome P450 n=1 Tax=Colletotrichum orchidophilum TaxID=1209926 RepID=A0A1G4AQW1_9PEZI|nr:uncharacterized protein CORC01_13161 [Colletotrichum orchidophilum]OHE91564.1 hypothetical protein CORC01_13161 [Colletotrichum orchidophilum]
MKTDSDKCEYIKTTEKNLPVFMATTVFLWMIGLFHSPVLRLMLSSKKDRLEFGTVTGIAKKISAERYGPDRRVQRDICYVPSSPTASPKRRQDPRCCSRPQSAPGPFFVKISSESHRPQKHRRLRHNSDSQPRHDPPHHHKPPRPHQIASKDPAEILFTTNATTTRRPIIADAEARNFPYLQAVIKEGLRIFPPVAGLMANEAPATGDTWNCAFIPDGTRVGLSAWGMFRREDVFGADAGEFRPERWLVEGHGGRTSLELLRKMEAMIHLLLRRFEFTVCDPLHPWKNFKCGIHVQSEYWIRAKRRE